MSKRRHLLVPVRVASEAVVALLPLLLPAATPAPNLPLTRTGPDGAPMMLVPAGPFPMGSDDGEADERPRHTVTLPAFYIDRFEVTHEQYARFLEASAHPAPLDWPAGRLPPKLARHPVVNVTFDDATAYARWAGKRLPTEAEWEKACRGTDGRNFPWGNSTTNKSTASGEENKQKLHPVGSFPDDLSPCGAQDMAGNVWEWTGSWYEAYPGNDQIEIEYGRKYRVIRGGGAIDYYGAVSTRRCADRARSVPYGTYDALGFRCVMEAK